MTAQDFNDKVWELIEEARKGGLDDAEIATEIEAVLAGLEGD